MLNNINRVRLNINTGVYCGYTLSLVKLNNNQWLDVSNEVYSTETLLSKLESGEYSIIED